jgi:hypothetical protein
MLSFLANENGCPTRTVRFIVGLQPLAMADGDEGLSHVVAAPVRSTKHLCIDGGIHT